MTLARAPRAVRNCNPGNIEANNTPWRGLAKPAEMTAEQRAEPRFCVFVAPLWGFRALAVLIRNYRDKHGIVTVNDIIRRFAPSHENDTVAYIRAVSQSVGVRPDAVLDLDDAAVLGDLCRAIAVHESGGWFFEAKDLAAAVTMVLPRPEPRVS